MYIHTRKRRRDHTGADNRSCKAVLQGHNGVSAGNTRTLETSKHPSIGKRKTVGQEISAVAGVPTLHSTLGSGWPASLLSTFLSIQASGLVQSKITSALCHTSEMSSGSFTRVTDHKLDSACLIMLPSNAVPLAVDLKLSRRPATPNQIDVRPCDPSAIPLHNTSYWPVIHPRPRT